MVVAWHIDRGSYDGTPLDDRNVVMAIHSPGHMMEVKWKAAVYLDQRCDQAQQDALTQIFSGQAGGHPSVLASMVGEIVGLKTVPIEFQHDGEGRRLSVTDVVSCDIQPIEGQGGAQVTVTNHPLCVSPGEPAVVCRSGALTLNDHGMTWNFSGKNGFFAPFSYAGA